MKHFLKLTLTIFLLISTLLIISCSKEQSQLPDGTMMYFEIENPENTRWTTYTIEKEQTDLFAKWQEEQKNELAQKDWEAYMENEN